MNGYHGCIFAYGQTSSGKTYTIHGTQSDPGMIPLSVESVFQFIETCPDREFVLRVSYLEVCNTPQPPYPLPLSSERASERASRAQMWE